MYIQRKRTYKGRLRSKIYYVPVSTYYDQTKIDQTEEWLKTIKEAKNAGYRAPKK